MMARASLPIAREIWSGCLDFITEEFADKLTQSPHIANTEFGNIGYLELPKLQASIQNRDLAYFVAGSILILNPLNWIVMSKPPCICRAMTPSLRAFGLLSVISVVTSPLIL